MSDVLWAVLIPVALLAVAGLVLAVWAARGTSRPVEHHSSMPDEPNWPDG
ncbi:hypothetical protein [Streptomyces sp. UH6]|nr:hypothetical protein [Streptomyces sp. UH6]NYV77539.1 hypothetical protein [Streptomyces sp. UH6]